MRARARKRGVISNFLAINKRVKERTSSFILLYLDRVQGLNDKLNKLNKLISLSLLRLKLKKTDSRKLCPL
jgi:hypothetical protein